MRFKLFAIAACLLAAPALADVDVALGNGDKVRGSLSPADEVETFRVSLPKGASLKVSLKGKKARGSRSLPSPELEVLLDDADASNGQIVKRGVASKLKKLIVAATDEYTIRVTGDGENTGEYDLKVSWKEMKKVSMDVELGEGNARVGFAAGAGALVDLSCKAAKGSDALPQLVTVHRSGGGGIALPPRGPPSASDREKKLPVPDLDDYEVEVTDGGAAGGTAVVQIKVKQAKSSKRKVAITDKQIGDGGDDSLALGELLGEGGGGFVVEEEDNPDIAGSGIDIPPDALSGTSVIVIGTAPDIDPDADGVEDQGPAVFFGPEGQEFDEPVTITIPFDPAGFAGDFSDLRIVQRDAKGKLTTIDPATYVIDEINARVSFQVSHFTSFQVFGPIRPQFDLNDDGIDDLVVNSPEGNGGMGVVYVFFGGAGLQSRGTALADVVIPGTQTNERFGATIAVGDVSGDGIADLVASSNAPGAESVSVFFGGPAFAPANSGGKQIELSSTGGEGDLQVRHLGDLTGDGFLDIAVGADSADSGTGRVFVFQGGPNLVPQSTATAFARLIGEGAGHLFGTDAKIADVTGDGVADIIAGADASGSPAESGKVYVWAGPIPMGFIELADDAEITITGEANGDEFGARLAVGDLNSDGTADIVSNQDSDFVSPKRGRIYVFFGGGTLADRSAAAADVILDGESVVDAFGLQFEVGDWTEDGIDDLLVGAPIHSGPMVNEGSVFFFEGRTDFATHTVGGAVRSSGSAPTDAYGGVRPPADLFGDGDKVFITFSPFNDFGGLDAGEFYVQRVLNGSVNADVIISGQAGEILGIEDD